MSRALQGFVLQVLSQVARCMSAYAAALDPHLAHVRSVTLNLAVLRRARLDIYRVLVSVMRTHRPQEQVWLVLAFQTLTVHLQVLAHRMGQNSFQLPQLPPLPHNEGTL